MSTTLQNGFFRTIMFYIAILGLFSPIRAQENIKLRMVPTVEAPVIEKKILKLNVDFVFNFCPQEYWVHFDRNAGRIIIEFLGYHLEAPPITIKGTSVVSDLSVINSETSMALNNKIARISMALQEGWHYDSWIIGGKVLRLQLWMPLNPGKILMSRKNRYVLPMVLIVFGIAVVTYFTIAVINNSHE